MQSASRFWVRTLVFSAALFAAWRVALLAGVRPYFVEDLGFLIPVVAVLLASKASLPRKASAIGVLVLLFALGDTVARLLGSASIAQTGRVDDDSLGARFGGALYHAFRLGLPVASLLAFTRGRPSSLWEQEVGAGTRPSTCPVCGVHKAGLEAHIRDVHGHKEVLRLKRVGLL